MPIGIDGGEITHGLTPSDTLYRDSLVQLSKPFHRKASAFEPQPNFSCLAQRIQLVKC
jgi:hypothetical protein